MAGGQKGPSKSFLAPSNWGTLKTLLMAEKGCISQGFRQISYYLGLQESLGYEV